MKKHLWIGLGLFAAFVLFTVLVAFVNVKPIGRQGTDVGFADWNERFDTATGEHDKLYSLTEKAGYLAVIPVLSFACIGLLQLIRRKSLRKVDPDILLMGGLYVALGICYVLFEKLVINYRPPYGNETELEASYPSSHTLLLVAVMATAVMQIRVRVKTNATRLALSLLCIITALFVICGRAVCGVHWLTDICGGLLLAGALSWLYYAFAFAGKEYPDTPYTRRATECVYAGPEDPYMIDVYAGPAEPDPEEERS